MICEVGKPFSLISNWGSGHNLSEKLWNLIDVCECSGQTSFYVRKALWKTFKRKEPERQALGRIPGSRPSAQSYIGPRARPKREALIVLGRQQRRFYFSVRGIGKLVGWCFQPSQPQRITSGLKNKTSVQLLVIHSTSHYTTSFLFSKPQLNL